jgi:hypothetical protein
MLVIPRTLSSKVQDLRLAQGLASFSIGFVPDTASRTSEDECKWY